MKFVIIKLQPEKYLSLEAMKNIISVSLNINISFDLIINDGKEIVKLLESLKKKNYS